jgi:hypothetical protein
MSHGVYTHTRDARAYARRPRPVSPFWGRHEPASPFAPAPQAPVTTPSGASSGPGRTRQVR